ncbi:MAG: GNAT family N-acetyltransferase [Oscillospiraceae bacterium]|nr:GNAT family N-acetyltransferase [Oscillospiraceae bacterium]
MPPYTFRELSWDSAFFNCRCARADLTGEITAGDAAEISRLAAGVDFLTVASPAQCGNDPLIAAHIGGYLADTAVTLTAAADTIAAVAPANPVRIVLNSAIAADPRLTAIAATAFTCSRFYRDPAIPDEKAAEMYRIWVAGAAERETYSAIYEDKTGTPGGFILFAPLEPQVWRIELAAVAEPLRGQGIGRSLLRGMAAWDSIGRQDEIRVVTQLCNHGAMNFYIDNGFRVAETVNLYHRHN